MPLEGQGEGLVRLAAESREARLLHFVIMGMSTCSTLVTARQRGREPASEGCREREVANNSRSQTGLHWGGQQEEDDQVTSGLHKHTPERAYTHTQGPVPAEMKTHYAAAACQGHRQQRPWRAGLAWQPFQPSPASFAWSSCSACERVVLGSAQVVLTGSDGGMEGGRGGREERLRD